MKFTMKHSTLERIVLGVGALSLLSFVGAEFAQCVPGWEWSYNSKGQNPCEIAGSLQAPCLGFSVYELGPLSNGSNYVTPQPNDTKAQSCGCNTVIYNLYTACTLCQFNFSYTGNTWAFWEQFCDHVYVGQYPLTIPFNASVPHWAYLDDSNSTFNPTLAKAAGRDPEATPTSPPTVAVSSSTSSSSPGSSQINPVISISGTKTSSDLPSTTSGGGGGGGGTKTHTGAIAGGVVGGLVGLAALSALAFFFVKRRRGTGDANGILAPNQMAYNTANDQQFYEPPKLYNPADPSTFPSPVSGGDSSNSGGYTTNPYQAGRYNGAAEL